jgi:hypothetical protein
VADLSAYIDFSVQLDKSVDPALVRLTDPDNYPAGVGIYIRGVFSVTQPDGISVDGNFTSPDVYSSGGQLVVATKELRLASDGVALQNGLYTITYTVQCTGYTDTVLTKAFTLDYASPSVIITPLKDVFTPQIQ